MDSQNMNIDIFHTHLSKYGIEGLLPQNLSQTLLKLFSTQFEAFQEEEEINEIILLLRTVIYLLKKEVEPMNTEEISELVSDDLMDKINIYGLNIIMEEIRRSGLIEISETNFPSLDNILDDNRDLVLQGDVDTSQRFLA